MITKYSFLGDYSVNLRDAVELSHLQFCEQLLKKTNSFQRVHIVVYAPIYIYINPKKGKT